MVVSVAQQEPVQRRVVPSQREPRRPTVVRTPDVVVAPEIDAVQGGRFSPLVHSGDEEDAGRIAAAPPVTTTLPRARVPKDGAARALTQRIRSIVRSARGRGRVSEERLLREISQVHFQLQRQSVRQSYQWRRGQPPRQSTRPVVTARPLTDAPSVGRRPRRHGRRPPSEPVRSQLGSVVVVPPPQSDAPSTSRRSRWVWRRRQVDQPVETEQTVGTVRRVDTVVPSVAAAVPMICDRAADDVEFSIPGDTQPFTVHEVSLYDDAEHYVPRQARRPPTAQSPVIPTSVVQGPRQPPAQGPIRPLVQGPPQVCIEADVSAADHVRSPFQFAVGHDVPPSRGRGWRGRGRSGDSDCPARNLYSRVPPPNLHPFPLTVESDSDDEMIDIIHHPTPSQSLSFADYNAFPTVRRHLIPEGGLVIDGGSDDDADVGRQDTSRQSFPHPRYGMRVEGASQQPSPAPPSTSVRGPLYSDSPSVHELHTLYVPPRPGWHASLFHSVGVPQSTDTLGLVESTADDEITFAPRLSSPFVDSCVERGLVPTTWTDGQARQQARVWRTDLPQTTRGLGDTCAPFHMCIRMGDLFPMFREPRQEGQSGGLPFSSSACISLKVGPNSWHSKLPLPNSLLGYFSRLIPNLSKTLPLPGSLIRFARNRGSRHTRLSLARLRSQDSPSHSVHVDQPTGSTSDCSWLRRSSRHFYFSCSQTPGAEPSSLLLAPESLPFAILKASQRRPSLAQNQRSKIPSPFVRGPILKPSTSLPRTNSGNFLLPPPSLSVRSCLAKFPTAEPPPSFPLAD
ncbi:hypothetical protein M5K25_010361 [Dendrobium thyrsiflorum]|uniref:Uncharacterized protein n=1 Tax=Dendrobium thyrsiflorum TaxID=117978 RepID=A0ABD0V009_DENTH